MAHSSVHPPAPADPAFASEADLDVWGVVSWLEAEGASQDLIGWVKLRGNGWKSTWKTCPRGDWVLAMAFRAGTPALVLRRATCEVAAMIEEDLEAPGLADAIRALRNASETGELPTDFVDDADRVADGAVDLAESLAWRVVSLAGRSFSDPEVAALVPSQLAELAMASVLDCAMMSALGATQARTAEVIRSIIPTPVLRKH